MNRDQLAHIVRAAAEIARDAEMIIIGSQSILGSYEDADLPDEATRSIEADVAFRDDPGGAKADDVDGTIGELSMFHETFGYYAQGVTLETARLPAGWNERLIYFDRADTGTVKRTASRGTTSSSPSSSPDETRTSSSLCLSSPRISSRSMS